jgi:hypothetical protein
LTTSNDLIEFHSISQLKFRYVRALDTHDWELMERCLTENAFAWFSGGKFKQQGRRQIVAFLRELIPASLVSSHIVVHPELTLTGPSTAKGIWRMQDIIYFIEPNPVFAHGNIEGGEEMTGAAYYHEEYEKSGDEWQISSIGFVRIFEVIERKRARAHIDLTVEPARGMRR